MRIVTTSWDDGDPSDLKIAGLLCSRHLPGTFYVPITGYNGGKTLSPTDLRALSSEGFEIGGHSVSHQSLPNLRTDQLIHEVRGCKHLLEQTLGEKVLMFCYPNGHFDAGVVQQVRDAGYKGARTTRMLSLETELLPFEMSTTVQAFPHPVTSYMRNLGKARNVRGLRMYAAHWRRRRSWVDLGKQLFDEVLKYGGIWHLYGHSWEIDQLALWDQLGELFDYVSNREGIAYLTNGQIVIASELSVADCNSRKTPR
jgi:peptidoglycan-N-acetylglucosamine deacetylase